MASVRKFSHSVFWYACFYGADGRRVQKSTDETDKRRAQKIADKYGAGCEESPCRGSHRAAGPQGDR